MPFRFVVDASSLVRAALTPASATGRLLDAVMDGRARLAVSKDMLDEVSEVLARPKFALRLPHEARAHFIASLGSAAELVAPAETVVECRDPGDDMVLEAALAAQQEGVQVVIVSDDRDLLALDPWRTMRVVKPEAALAMLVS